MEKAERVGDAVRKIALVGFSASSREDAPFGDPSFELWGMNNLHTVLPGKQWHRWFDMHQRDYMEANNPLLGSDHLQWLRESTIPVYMLRESNEFPTSVRYPLEDIQECMLKSWNFEPRELKYFHSTASYPIALALYEGVDEIHIYGIDMVKDSEYDYQRPNAEGWICLARQQPSLSDPSKKVRVVVADKCALLKGPGLYGYEDKDYALPMKFALGFIRQRDEITKRLDEAKKKYQDAKDEVNTLNGYLQCSQHWCDRMADVMRGAEP